MKYGKQIVKDICKLIESDDYTQKEICEQVGINQDTFTDWKHNHSDFSDAIKKADRKRLRFFAVEARKSMLKKIQGYDYEETHSTMIPSKDKEGAGVIKEQKKIKKHIPPDSTLLMYVLNNTDPENFRHKEHMEHTGKDGNNLFQSMTDEELITKINKISKSKPEK